MIKSYSLRTRGAFCYLKTEDPPAQMHTSGSDPGSFHLWSAFGKQSHDLGITEIQRRAIVRKELPLEFEGDWKQVSVHLKLSQHC